MKGKKKYIVPLLLAGVTATGVVANVQQQQNYQVQANEIAAIDNIEGAELKLKPHELAKETYNINDKVYLPEYDSTVLDGCEVKFTVKKGDKELKPEQLKNDGEGLYFKAEYMGYYNITVEAVKKGKVVSKIDNLSVFVEKEDASIKLPVNSQYVIPAKMQKGQDNFKIPAPSVVVTDEDGEETTKELGKNLTTDDLKVVLYTPTKAIDDLELKYGNEELKENPYFEVNGEEHLAEVGTYQIVYEYRNDDSVISRLESNFQVVNEYKTEDIKLAMTFLDSMPATGNVKTDVSIPKVKVTDTSTSTTDAVNAYVEVTVKNVKTNKVVKVDYDNFTFHPEEIGTYTVTYQAFIPVFGSTVKTAPITRGEMIVVTDKKAPTVMPTYAYTFDANGEIATVNGIAVEATTEKTAREVAEEMLVNRKVDIPSIAVMKDKNADDKTVAKVTIPAAYAVDNFYTFKGAINDDITITRTYRQATGSVHTVTKAANEAAEIEFTSKGNAEIRYKAVDKDNNTLGEVVYDIVIYENNDDIKNKLLEGETKIDLNVGNTIISNREKTFTFAKPTATDTFDKNIEVRTFYKIGGVEYEFDETFENKEGKYELDIANLIASNPTATSFDVYAKAYLDTTLMNTRGEDPDKNQLVGVNFVESKVETIKIMKSSADTKAPKFDVVTKQFNNGAVVATDWNSVLFHTNKAKLANATATKIGIDGYLYNGSTVINIPDTTVQMAAFDQGDTIITLPEVQFTEDYDHNMSISLKITDKFGNEVSKVDQELVEMNDKVAPYIYTIKNATFKLSTYGVYTVTYTAKDMSGKITVKSFGIRVNDKTAPTIIVDDEDKFGKEIEVGEYFQVPAARLIKDGKSIEMKNYAWKIYKKSDGADCEKLVNGFVPTSEGTFFIRYHATDELGNDATLQDSMFIVTAKDTTAPTIQIDNTYFMRKVMKWKPADGDNFMTVNIPVAFATDKKTKQDIEVVYTVTGPNGSKPTVSSVEGNDSIKSFKATAQGVYTIKYTATDDAGNERVETKTIEIGDCQAPELTWVNKDKDLPEEVKLNESYVLDLNSMIKLTDNETSEADLIKKITVQLTGPDGTTVTSDVTEGYQWTFTKAGSYTMKITVKDNVGNTSTPYTYEINVPAEDAEESKVSPVLGTVLVVLSVVVLAGVVVYFVASSKKKSTKKTSKKSK